MNITVYLGAFEGKDASLKQAVREIGTWIGAEMRWYMADQNPD